MPLAARIAAAALLFAASLIAGGPARAQSCNFTISDMTFGAVDVIAGGAVDFTSTLSISCTGVLLTDVRICPHLNEGSGGADASARYMTGPGGATLAYQLYQDAARTTVWGSGYWGLPGDPPTIILPLGLSGSASTNRIIYGRVFGGQNLAPAGSYSSSFAGAETTIDYGLDLLGLLPCASLPILSDTAQAPFTVSASVVSNCLLSAQDINFGMHGVLTANVDATGEVAVTCTPDTAYSVALDNGLTGSGPAARLMTNGPNSITYGLYKDAARSQPWGDSGTPGSEVAGTGNGLSQQISVYGRVPPQTTPPPGSYSDTIVVTLTY